MAPLRLGSSRQSTHFPLWSLRRNEEEEEGGGGGRRERDREREIMYYYYYQHGGDLLLNVSINYADSSQAYAN